MIDMKRLMIRADRSDDRDVRKGYITDGLEAGFSGFVLREGDECFEELGRMDAIYTHDNEFTDHSYISVSIDGPGSMEDVMSLAGKKKAVIVETTDWTMIPLENLIAAFDGSGTELYVSAKNSDDAKLYLTTMEKGVDGIIIAINDPTELSEFKRILSASPNEDLSEVTVVSVRRVEMGDRVCIDTCSMMSPGEGMLIGSYSNCLFLIQSESEDNGYVASRPFRVNAGAVHSYIEVPDGGTRYLSELRSGDDVLLCNGSGRTRVASIGRCKIEKRPLLMVTATDGMKEYSVILQNAETVKMVKKDGSESVTKLRPGDKILARIDTGGRHFGIPVDESISEI